jgi:hypothetical protein
MLIDTTTINIINHLPKLMRHQHQTELILRRLELLLPRLFLLNNHLNLIRQPMLKIEMTQTLLPLML